MPEAGENNGNSPLSLDNDKKGIPTGSITTFDPDAKSTVNGDKRDSKVGLTHELLGHGYDSDQGKTNFMKTANGIPMYEVSAVNAENRVRIYTGDAQRISYGGKLIPKALIVVPSIKKR